MGATLCGEVSENDREEDLKGGLVESCASSHITYKKKDMTNIKKFEIYVTVGNSQKMKFNIKGSVNINLKGGETVNLTKVLYVPQAFNNILSI